MPIERQLPTKAELKTREELDLVEMFVEAFASNAQHEDDVMLARRLLSHESVEFVLAGLLRDHLGSRPEANSTAIDNRRSRMPTRASNNLTATTLAITADTRDLSKGAPLLAPIATRASNPVLPGTDIGANLAAHGRGKRGPNSAAPEPRPRNPPIGANDEDFDFQYTVSELQDGDTKGTRIEQAGRASEQGRVGHTDSIEPGTGNTTTTAEIAEVFVNVGRRDGVSSEDVLALLAQRAPKSAILHVSVRHNHTFVGVKRPDFQTVLGALDGANLAGRVARAQPARSNRD